MVFTNQ